MLNNQNYFIINVKLFSPLHTSCAYCYITHTNTQTIPPKYTLLEQLVIFSGFIRYEPRKHFRYRQNISEYIKPQAKQLVAGSRRYSETPCCLVETQTVGLHRNCYTGGRCLHCQWTKFKYCLKF